MEQANIIKIYKNETGGLDHGDQKVGVIFEVAYIVHVNRIYDHFICRIKLYFLWGHALHRFEYIVICRKAVEFIASVNIIRGHRFTQYYPIFL